MSAEWFIGFDGEAYGPYSMAELAAGVAANKLSKEDWVWCAGMPAWAPAASVLAFWPQPTSATQSKSRDKAITVSWKERTALIAIGHTTKRIEEYVFDWLLYGTVVVTCNNMWGPVQGSVISFLIMAPLSAVVCLIYLTLYMWAKKDWFGLEAIRGFDASMFDGGRVSRMVQRVVHWGQLPAFFALSIYADPFLTTVYLRAGREQYGRLSAQDMDVFWMSVLLSNAYWTLRWTVLAEIAMAIWQHYLGPLSQVIW